MPLYEYHCHDCDETVEVLVMAGEEPDCPECQGKHLEKLLSVPGSPQIKAGGAGLKMACRSEGPPCGQHCSRAL